MASTSSSSKLLKLEAFQLPPATNNIWLFVASSNNNNTMYNIGMLLDTTIITDPHYRHEYHKTFSIHFQSEPSSTFPHDVTSKLFLSQTIMTPAQTLDWIGKYVMPWMLLLCWWWWWWLTIISSKFPENKNTEDFSVLKKVGNNFQLKNLKMKPICVFKNFISDSRDVNAKLRR